MVVAGLDRSPFFAESAASSWTGMIVLIVSGDVMEIAGESETAGLSSRSIDGYSESYIASATTTVFSARRIWYEDRAKKIIKHHLKGLWG